MAENLYSYRKAQQSLDHLRTAYHNYLPRPVIRLAAHVVVAVSKAVTWLTQAMNRLTQRLSNE